MLKEKITPQQSVQFWAELKVVLADLLNSGKPKEHTHTLDMMFEAFLITEFGNDQQDRNKFYMLNCHFKALFKVLKKHNIFPGDMPMVPDAQTIVS